MGIQDQLEALPDDLEYLQAPIPNRDIGPAGELVWLPLEHLFIDRDYQRHVLDRGKRNIKAMIEEFSWALFGALVVGRRGLTRFAVIDGQHRAIAAAMRGDIEKVPCIVLQGGKKQEARAFAAINSNVTRIHPLQAFRASVVAGDPDSVATVRLVEQAGVKIVAYPKTDLKAGETQCLGLIRQSLRRYGHETTIAGLKLIRAMDPAGGLSKNAVIGSVVMFSKHPEWIDRAEELGCRVGLTVAKLDIDAKQRKMSYGGLETANFEQLLTKAIENSQRVSSRFASPEMERRAMAGR